MMRRSACFVRRAVLAAVLLAFASLPLAAQDAGAPSAGRTVDFQAAWNWYLGEVRKGATAIEREQLLRRMMAKPGFTAANRVFLGRELRRVRTDVAFGEAMRYYRNEQKKGLTRAERERILGRIIARFEPRGVNVSALKDELAALRAPAAPPTPAPDLTPLPPPPAAEAPASAKEPPPAFHPAGIEGFLLAGAHAYPETSYFRTQAARFDAEDFTGPAFLAGFGQRVDATGWRAEAGHYGASVSYETSTAAGRARLEASFVRVAAVYHFLAPSRPADLSFSVGAGPYFWRKEVKETSTGASVSDSASGIIFGLHAGVRTGWRFTRALRAFVDASFAFAAEDDPGKVRSGNAGDSINFGGPLVGAGVSYVWGDAEP